MNGKTDRQRVSSLSNHDVERQLWGTQIKKFFLRIHKIQEFAPIIHKSLHTTELGSRQRCKQAVSRHAVGRQAVVRHADRQ